MEYNPYDHTAHKAQEYPPHQSLLTGPSNIEPKSTLHKVASVGKVALFLSLFAWSYTNGMFSSISPIQVALVRFELCLYGSVGADSKFSCREEWNYIYRYYHHNDRSHTA